MALLKNGVNKLLEQFSEYTKDPTSFLTNQPEVEQKLKILVKQCYDYSKLLENRSNVPSFTLPKLLIKNFDAEQVWQQIELQNNFLYNKLNGEIQPLLSIFRSSEVDEDENCLEPENQSMSDNESSEHEEKKILKKKVRFAFEEDVAEDKLEDKITVTDEEASDEEEEDDKEKSDDSDETDDFQNEDSVTEVQNPRDGATKIFDNISEDDNNRIRSSFEERQERLKQRVKTLEESLLAEKPWLMKGEVTAKKRPEDSLLSEVLEFDLSSRPAPIITEEAALKLEDVIKNRVINRVWDDVERKVKPIDTPREFKKKLVLDQEKSKLSLAQVYEQDYLKQREAVNPEKQEKDEEEPKEHKRLRVLLDSLFRKLDALSNYHYTPLPSIPEPQIVTNISAVTLEEAIPDATSTATLLAPEEVQGKIKGDLIGKDERSTTDKKRARRKKKVRQRVKHQEIKANEKMLEKLKPHSKNKFAKEKAQKDLERLLKDKAVSHFQENITNGKSSKSSQQFFARLQDAVTSDDKIKKKRKSDSVNIDPKKIKL